MLARQLIQIVRTVRNIVKPLARKEIINYIRRCYFRPYPSGPSNRESIACRPQAAKQTILLRWSAERLGPPIFATQPKSSFTTALDTTPSVALQQCLRVARHGRHQPPTAIRRRLGQDLEDPCGRQGTSPLKPDRRWRAQPPSSTSVIKLNGLGQVSCQHGLTIRRCSAKRNFVHGKKRICYVANKHCGAPLEQKRHGRYDTNYN